MNCFTPERIAELEKGSQLTAGEINHTYLCDGCLEKYLEHGSEPVVEAEDDLVWSDKAKQYLPRDLSRKYQ